MLVKIILIFLLAMVLLGMVGKLLFPGAAAKLTRRRPAVCADCGRPRLGKAPCDCRKKGGKA
jgi:hypothetical protein